MAHLYLLVVVWVVLQVFVACKSISIMVIELWAVEAFCLTPGTAFVHH
jgi:hypothetical protein